MTHEMTFYANLLSSCMNTVYRVRLIRVLLGGAQARVQAHDETVDSAY